MAGQAVERDQGNPFIHGVECSPAQQIFFQSRDFPQRFGVEENQQIFRRLFAVFEINLRQAGVDLLQGGRAQPGRTRTRLSGLTSQPQGTRPRSAASSSVVPRPMNGSWTRSPGSVSRSMKKRGSCGLKQAR